ncbi:MAG: amidohydrolase family protein [Candidatus Odinarchaeota archaeon]
MTKSSKKSPLFHTKFGMEIIDSHSHYLSAATFKSWQVRTEAIQHRIRTRTDMTSVDVPSPDEDFAQKWVTELDKNSISRIGMMVGPESWNEFTDALKRFPDRFYGYANINPLLPDAEEQARYAIKELGFHGFKLYPVLNGFHTYDKEAYQIYQIADELKVPVLHHFGISIGAGVDLRYGNPLDLQPVARDFPDVKFGIAHLGAGMFRETLLLFYQTDNVYVDTSGSNVWMRYIPYPSDLEGVMKRALEAGGPKRIVFGTDSSMFPRGFRYDILEKQLSIFQRLKVSSEDLEHIFCKNIRKIMGNK